LKILITGADGQLGLSLKKVAPDNLDIFYYSRKQFDVCNLTQMELVISKVNPAFIVNCAAYTAVDNAEDNIEKCNGVNIQGVKNIIEICLKYSIKLIHVSTDFVFDGTSNSPYSEENQTNPINIYGKSKLQAEELINNSNYLNAIIIRTSWVFSEFGHNFVKTIIKLSKENDELKIINDQYGKPTYAPDLAKVIYKLIEKPKYTTFNFSNEITTTWHEFSKEIINETLKNQQIEKAPTIIAIKSDQFPQKAKRPKNSSLDNKKISKHLNITIRDWREVLKECVKCM